MVKAHRKVVNREPCDTDVAKPVKAADIEVSKDGRDARVKKTSRTE